MRLINAIVDALRRAFGTAGAPQIGEAEIFEAERGVWKIRVGSKAVGRFDSRERARRTAQDWNLLSIIKQKKQRQHNGKSGH